MRQPERDELASALEECLGLQGIPPVVPAWQATEIARAYIRVQVPPFRRAVLRPNLADYLAANTPR